MFLIYALLIFSYCPDSRTAQNCKYLLPLLLLLFSSKYMFDPKQMQKNYPTTKIIFKEAKKNAPAWNNSSSNIFLDFAIQHIDRK